MIYWFMITCYIRVFLINFQAEIDGEEEASPSEQKYSKQLKLNQAHLPVCSSSPYEFDTPNLIYFKASLQILMTSFLQLGHQA